LSGKCAPPSYERELYEHIEYTPYGELWVERTASDLAKTPFRFTGKELDEEAGLYYYGARYLNPQTSMWLSTDPAMGEYIPRAPIDDDARKYNQNLPGMGGVFNYVNLHAYHYAGNNPVKYVDPTGKELRINFFVTEITENTEGGRTAKGYIIVSNMDTKKSFRIDNVASGGQGRSDFAKRSEPAPFGTYDILDKTPGHGDGLYQRLEAHDGNYGDDKIDFEGQNEHSLVRLHYAGSGATWGCISVPDDDAEKIQVEMENTSTSKVHVDSKSTYKIKRFFFPRESQTKYGEIRVIDLTSQEQR
jgi:RHS repeat-associated protein